MNERIEELAEGCFEYIEGTLDGDIVEFNYEKFAELIVKECAQVAVFKDGGMIATAEVAGYMAAGRSTAARMIKEHFGVEE